MSVTRILGTLLLLLAGSLVLLNPSLLAAVGAGVIVGLAAWRLRAVLGRSRTEVVSLSSRRSLASSNRMIPLIGVAVAALGLFVLNVFSRPAGGLLFTRPVVRVGLTFSANYDDSKATWTVNERIDLSDAAVAEIRRLLTKEGSSAPAAAAPDEIAMLFGAQLGGGTWAVGLDTGRPTLTKSVEIDTPEGGPWSYNTSLPVSMPSGRTFDLEPADGTVAVLETPRHLVLQAAPPVTNEEALPGDTHDTMRIQLPNGSRQLRLSVAPAWARNDVTAWAMTVSLGNLAQLVVGAIAAAVMTAFGAGSWAWLRSRWMHFRHAQAPNAPTP